MLDIDELLELEEILRTEIDENLEHILVKLNATGKLKDLLSLLVMGKYLETDEDNMVIRDGEIDCNRSVRSGKRTVDRSC